MEENKHESFGLVSLSRVSCTPKQVLFGSSVTHSEYIQLTVSRASHIRDLNNDHYHEEGTPLIEIAISPSQLGDLFTSMNYGSGVPCTIQTFNGEDMEAPPIVNKRLQHIREFQKSMERLAASLDNLTAFTEERLAKSGPLNKSEREKIIREIQMIRQEVGSNIPFYQKQFEEQMEKSISEAKAAVDAFVESRRLQSGLKAMPGVEIGGYIEEEENHEEK